MHLRGIAKKIGCTHSSIVMALRGQERTSKSDAYRSDPGLLLARYVKLIYAAAVPIYFYYQPSQEQRSQVRTLLATSPVYANEY